MDLSSYIFQAIRRLLGQIEFLVTYRHHSDLPQYFQHNEYVRGFDSIPLRQRRFALTYYSRKGRDVRFVVTCSSYQLMLYPCIGLAIASSPPGVFCLRD